MTKKEPKDKARQYKPSTVRRLDTLSGVITSYSIHYTKLYEMVHQHGSTRRNTRQLRHTTHPERTLQVMQSRTERRRNKRCQIRRSQSVELEIRRGGCGTTDGATWRINDKFRLARWLRHHAERVPITVQPKPGGNDRTWWQRNI